MSDPSPSLNISTGDQISKLQNILNDETLPAVRELSPFEKKELLTLYKQIINDVNHSNENNHINSKDSGNQLQNPVEGKDSPNDNEKKMIYQEQLDIQKKLSQYDNTLRETLDAINSGKLNEDLLEPIFDSLPSDTQMNQLLKEINTDKIKKLKVSDEMSVSLESDDDNQHRKQNVDINDGSSADEYIEKMIKIINQNKKFDNFLEEVSKVENLSNNDLKKLVNDDDNSSDNNRNDNSNNKINKESDNGTFEVTFTENGDIINTDPEVFKKMINLQILKTLKSFEFDDNLSKDIANTISRSYANSKSFNIKNFWSDDFTDQVLHQQMQYLQSINAPNANTFVQDAHNFSINHIQDYYRKREQSMNEDEKESLRNEEKLFYKKREERMANLLNNKPKNTSFEFECVSSNPTLEEKQKLRRETLEILRMQDAQIAEESGNSTGGKKKNKKKKKKNSSSNFSNHIQNDHSLNNDMWLCGLCEFKIVYGELPIYLLESVQKSTFKQQKQENYQRYLIAQKQERKRMQHVKNQNHDYDHDHDQVQGQVQAQEQNMHQNTTQEQIQNQTQNQDPIQNNPNQGTNKLQNVEQLEYNTRQQTSGQNERPKKPFVYNNEID